MIESNETNSMETQVDERSTSEEITVVDNDISNEIELVTESDISEEPTLKSKKTLFAVLASALVLIAVLVVLYSFVVSPMLKYNKAQELANGKKYSEAIKIYQKLDDYKDSKEQVEICKVEQKIASLGTITADSKKKIDDAQKDYDKLNKKCQKQVGNKKILEKAQSKYWTIKAKELEQDFIYKMSLLILQKSFPTNNVETHIDSEAQTVYTSMAVEEAPSKTDTNYALLYSWNMVTREMNNMCKTLYDGSSKKHGFDWTFRIYGSFGDYDGKSFVFESVNGDIKYDITKNK